MNKSVVYFLFFFFSFYPFLNAQKTFNVTLQLPKDLGSGYSIFYDNGKTEIPLISSPINDTILNFKRLFFSKYASIIIRKLNGNETIEKSFFINEKKARIIIYNEFVKSQFENYKLFNALDFKKEKIGLKYNDSSLVSKVKQFDKDEKKLISKMGDSLYYIELNNLMKSVYIKDLEYLISSPKTYFSQWYFRRAILPMGIMSYDSLLKVYDFNFPDELKSTEEGKFILNNIKGNIAIKNMGFAPLVQSKDITGNQIDIKKKLREKEILIIFGATWCVPCIKEIPIIQSILQNFPNKKLDVLYVAYVSSLVEFKKMVESNKMDWINIYNDIDLINSFGGYRGIPRMYLIDKNGKIIYVNQNDETYDYNFSKLKYILKQLYNN